MTSAGGDEGASVVRHEEELGLGTRVAPIGSVGVQKRVDEERVTEDFVRQSEDAHVERVPAGQEDSGKVETLPDGSVSIPVFEEELVVTKRRVVRERIIVRKSVRTHRHPVEATLLKERVEVSGDLSEDDTPDGAA